MSNFFFNTFKKFVPEIKPLPQKDFFIRVIRYKKNADFIQPNPKNRFHARTKNNFCDRIQIERYNRQKMIIEVLFDCPCQAWANHPDAPSDGSWSLATGTFTVHFFEPRRAFFSPVHGIGNGYDKNGNFIDPNTFDLNNSGNRFLIHDDLNSKGLPYTGGYSQGCVIIESSYFKKFNEYLISKLKVTKGDKANMGVVEL